MMRMLFVGDMRMLAPYARYFAADASHEARYVANRRGDAVIPHARRIILEGKLSIAPDEGKTPLRWWKDLADAAAKLEPRLRVLAEWRPDVVFSASSVLFCLRELFPHSRLVSWGLGESGRAPMLLDCLRLLESDLFIADAKEISRLPAQLKSSAWQAPLMIDTDFYNPDKAGDFVCWKFSGGDILALDLRGLPLAEILRFLEMALKARPVLNIVAAVSGRKMRKYLEQVLARLPEAARGRLFLADRFEPEEMRALWSRARLCYFGQAYGREMLECMACGGLAAAPAGEGVLRPGENMLAMPDPDASKISEIVRHFEDYAPVREQARADVKSAFDLEKILPDFATKILNFCLLKHMEKRNG